MRALALGLSIASAAVLAACQLLPAGEPATPTPTPRQAAKPVARPTAVVQRGSIVETIRLLGRVAAVKEADLYFNTAGRLKIFAAQPGQEVQLGQVLAELDVSDLPSRIEQAKVTLETAQVKLEQLKAKAVDAEARRKLDLRSAELAVQKAEDDVRKAESELAAAEAGPSLQAQAEAAVRDATAALEAARRNVVLAQKSATVSQLPRDRQNEHNWYEVRYGETLERFRKGQASQADVDRDWSSLLTAKERLDSAHAEAALTLSRAENDVAQAEDKLKKVQADLEAKRLLPPDQHVRPARLALEQARLALDKARADYDQKLAAKDDDYELALQQKAVDQARVSLDQLKQQLADARLVAPFGGRVNGARGRIGDQVAAFQPLINLADPAQLQVRGDLLESDVVRVALGQEVRLTVDALPGVELKGRVVGVPSRLTPGAGQVPDRSVQIQVDWPRSGAQLGMLARTTIVVQQKDDVLVVPARAVKTVGKRRFVEYLDGTMRRAANVEVGVTTDAEAEILSGLREGQTILVGQ